MATRRDRFRECLARLDVAASSKLAEQNLYVERPEQVLSKIVPLLDVSPASLHALVGGIGSGKTTQLLVAEERLRKTSNVATVYVDVSLRQDLSRMGQGALLGVLGLALAELEVVDRSPDISKEVDWFEQWATGYREEYQGPDGDDDEYATWVPGVVTPPPRLSAEMKLRARQLGAIRRSRLPPDVPLMFFIDAVDRIDDMNVFRRLVNEDLVAVQSAGAGAVVASPHGVLWGAPRVVLDRFVDVLNLPFVDVGEDEDGVRFLSAVLERRAGAVVSAEMRGALVKWSGGVLRDLLRLAWLAVREAYSRGVEGVENVDIERAVDALGRTLMLGLTVDDAVQLKRLHAKGVKLEMSEREVSYVASRRVLVYEQGHAVHPSLVPMLAQVAGP